MAKAAEESKRSLYFQSEVKYSRFFTASDEPDDPVPAPLSWNNRWKGAWLPCSTTASLSLFLMPPSGRNKFALAVSINGDDLIEEHLLCNLSFSWPQVSCVPKCPIRGSSAVFISYEDQSNQIQKFAVRFSDSDAAEIFLNRVKECVKQMAADSAPKSKQKIGSKVVPFKHHYKRKRAIQAKDVISVKSDEDQEPIAICRADVAPQYLDNTNDNTKYNNNGHDNTNYYNNNNGYDNNNYNNGYDSLIEPLMACDDLDALLGLPPGFTHLLTNPPGQIMAAGGAYNCYQNSLAIEASESKVMSGSHETDMMAQIMKNMNGESFQAASMCKIEKLAGEMGQAWFA